MPMPTSAPAPRTPAEYGKMAFKAGKPCAPALDQRFLKRFCNGTPGTSQPALRAWQAGWTQASLAEAVADSQGKTEIISVLKAAPR